MDSDSGSDSGVAPDSVMPDWDRFCSDPSLWETDFDFDGGLELREIMPIFAERNRVGKLIEILKPIQVKIDELEAKFLEERSACITKYKPTQSQGDALKAMLLEELTALEAKYHKLYEPLYNQRWKIVNGTVDREDGTTRTLENPAEDKRCEEKGVPDFWQIVLEANDAILPKITEDDYKVLKFLEDIRWSLVDKPKGFKIEFFFRENHFFKNQVLSKTYHMMDLEDLVPEEAIGTQIEWYQDICQTPIAERLQKQSKNTMHTEIKGESESFFSFFDPPQVCEADEINVKQLQSQMEQDFKVGSAIRNEIIPHAIESFVKLFEWVVASDDDEPKNPNAVPDDYEGDENDEYLWG